MRISRWINWRSRWLRGRCGTRPRSMICGRTGIEVPRRRPLVISRKLPLPVEMLESIFHARGTNAWGKKKVIARALSAKCASPIFLSPHLSFSLHFCHDAANWKWDLVPCKADRSLRTLCLWSARLIWFFHSIKCGLTREKQLHANRKAPLTIILYAFSLPETDYCRLMRSK